MAMASISKFLPGIHGVCNPVSLHSSLGTLSFPSYRTATLLQRRLLALKTGSDGGEIWSEEAYGSNLIRKPIISSGKELDGVSGEDEEVEEDRNEEKWVDWEDQILEDTVPLVNFVRMILHSAKYESGERLSPEHEKTILERLLHYHPEVDKKIGCGIDYITVGYHPDFENSRCLFIVRKDGELVDFSYWKCIKGLIRKKYPLFADSFILRYFRRGRRKL